MIPLLGLLIPTLIQGAEAIFSKGDEKDSGAQKKKFVLDFIGKLFDFLKEKGDVPGFVTKDIVLELSSMLIEHYVPVLT